MILHLPRFLIAIVFLTAGVVLTLAGEWSLIAAAWIEGIDISEVFD